MARICLGRSTGCFIYSFVIQVISEKHCVAKVLLAIWEIILHENNRNYNSYRFSYKFAFILFLSFLTNQKQESGFQQIGGLVTRIISVFCLKQVALYFKSHSNSIELYKGILLHVYPVRIIVPCFEFNRHLTTLLSYLCFVDWQLMFIFILLDANKLSPGVVF